MRIGQTLGMLIGAVTALVGCSGFDRAWEQAAQTPPSADTITGRWSGTWQSNENDHSGNLRAIITQNNDGSYLARYHATYAGFLTFETEANLTAQQTDNRVELQGEEDLGWLAGGVYQYRGHATPTEFFSTYQSKHDHGTYQMTRP